MATRTGSVSAGIINARNAQFQIVVEGHILHVKNIDSIKITRKINYDEKVCLGDSSARYYVTYGAYSGQMSVYPDSGVWMAVANYQDKLNAFPRIDFRASLPVGASLSSRQEIASPRMDEANLGYFDFTLYGVIFDELPMIAASGTGYADAIDMNFVANGATITNMLPDHDILDISRAITNQQES